MKHPAVSGVVCGKEVQHPVLRAVAVSSESAELAFQPWERKERRVGFVGGVELRSTVPRGCDSGCGGRVRGRGVSGSSPRCDLRLYPSGRRGVTLGAEAGSLMKLLILAGSKHGATLEVAETIGDRLAERGLEVEVAEVGDDHGPLAGFDGVIVGSAVYAGHWFKAAKRWVVTHREAIAERPTWLFSVGPLGDPPEPQEDPVDVADLITAVGACDHHLFAGALDKDDLNLVERAAIRAVQAPFGDFRDWDDIQDWADGIADELHAGDEPIAVAG